MDAILGDKPSTKPPVVVESLESKTVSEELLGSAQDDDKNESVQEQSQEDACSSSRNACTCTPVTQASSKTATPERKWKRLSGKGDSAVLDLLEQVAKAQGRNDERMIELEEKRLMMEEQQLEREGQQQREEQEFQMQMMTMMMNVPHFPPFGSQNCLIVVLTLHYQTHHVMVLIMLIMLVHLGQWLRVSTEIAIKSIAICMSFLFASIVLSLLVCFL